MKGVRVKYLCLDLGDTWVGSAISDYEGLFVRPYKTVDAAVLHSFLQDTLAKEHIEAVVVGNPITLKGTRSTQTEKIHTQTRELEQRFATVTWVLWDERLTSKWASGVRKAVTKEDKLKAHSIAAAFILESYLQYKNSRIE